MNRSAISIKPIRKFVPICILGIVALSGGVSPAWAQVSLGAASEFSILGGTNVTCTSGSVVTGDIGVYPGSFTNTGCTMAGGSPPATNAAAALAQADLLRAYSALQSRPCTQTISTAAFTGNVPALGPLAPGVYCFPAGVTFTNTTLTLIGPSNGIWIFKVGAALTGTNFSVVMADHGRPCNVFWSVGAGVTMTTSALKGNILAGNATDGAITLTGGSVAGRALAKVAVTVTGASVIGCDALAGKCQQNAY
ncbi:ice-binding family protein [Paraherbaspirillum soli]|uniref:Ice-binding family protein n=1 Tax=Paraherbaspirillum soli TaxID=631222 RepID=A0ABW0M974_9BURK